MISLKALQQMKRNRPELFEPDPHYFPNRDEIVMRRRLTFFQKHNAWLCSLNWPARICAVICELTIAYLALVLGMFVGLALRYLIVS